MKLSIWLKQEEIMHIGFNRAGIYRMKQFYETYKDNEIVAPLVRQISWTHNVMCQRCWHKLVGVIML